MIEKNKITKQSRIIILLCLLLTISKAQINLIPNPSFEDSLSIPLVDGEFVKCKKWYTILGSVDYYSVYSPVSVLSPSASVHIPNNCLGYQNTKHGNYYVGICLRAGYNANYPYFNYKECIGIKLNQQLIANHSYSYTMYVSLADGAGYACNQLQAYFTTNQFTVSGGYDTTSNYLSYQVQSNNYIADTANWTPITKCFIAQGGEEYLSIGNFKDALHTSTLISNNSGYPCAVQQTANNASYIYIDDLSLYDMGLYIPASAKNDSLICNGTAINISANPIKDSSVVVWSPPTALSCTNCPNPVATPTTTTLYYVNKSICGATSKDSILVTVHTPTTIAKAGNDMLLCMEDKGVFIGTTDSTYFTSYNWAPNTGLSCTNCATPYANPTTTTIYNLTRKECNVTTTSTVKVTIDDCNPTYTVPNVFTPNYDGVNDTWGVTFSSSKYIKNFQLQIYDRWGLLVFSTNSQLSTPNLRWDGHTTSGEECTNGVYYYIISFEKNGEKVELKGTINLFR